MPWLSRARKQAKQICFIVCFIGSSILACSAAAASAPPAIVSVGRPYTVSPEPTYLKYSPYTISHVLTDGKYATGRMWVSQDALTWRSAGKITFSLDLGDTVSVDEVSVHAAAGTAGGVRFPGSMLVYLSNDGKTYTNVGDLLTSASADQDQNYVEKTFTLKGINRQARYVRIEIQASPPFFVMDEVQVVSGEKASALSGGIPVADIGQDAVSRHITSAAATYTKRDNAILTRMGAPKGGTTLTRRSQLLRNRFPGKDFVIQLVSPWANVSPLGMPSNIATSDDFRVSIPVGDCAYRAFVATNTSQQGISLTLGQGTSTDALAVNLFEAQEVRDTNGVGSYDPLIPLGTKLTLDPGISRYVMVKMCGRHAGSAVYHLTATENGTVGFTLRGNTDVLNLDTSAAPLQATTWSYLTGTKFRSNASQAVQDLITHHESAVVIPLGTLGATPASGLGKLDSYLSLYDTGVKSAKFNKAFLFLELKGANGANLNSVAWKKSFLSWYASVRSTFEKHGWRSDSIYFYPYDEPTGSDSARVIAFYRWFKSSVPGGKLFVTIDNRPSFALADYVDISCIARSLISTFNKKGETWVYAADGPAKSNDIYGYYRLLPWTAVANAAAGVGFWSYSNISDQHGGWNDYSGTSENYSPVYFDHEGILRSSRRWEAWRAGLEDAALVRLLEKKHGAASTRQFIQKVLNSKPGTPTDAEAIRQQIIDALVR